jgi:hypothetical protein
MLVEQLATRGAHELALFYFDAKRKGVLFGVGGTSSLRRAGPVAQAAGEKTYFPTTCPP